MNVIIHDLSQEDFERLFPVPPKDTTVISDKGTIQKCVGCFGCWLKTPGECVIHDGYESMGRLLGQTDRLTIISKCSFGGYSSFVKNVIDRCISISLPYFTLRKGEMHHKSRYRNHIRLNVFFYGEDMSDNEKATAQEFAAANALNMNGVLESVQFAKHSNDFKNIPGQPKEVLS